MVKVFSIVIVGLLLALSIGGVAFFIVREEAKGGATPEDAVNRYIHVMQAGNMAEVQDMLVPGSFNLRVIEAKLMVYYTNLGGTWQTRFIPSERLGFIGVEIISVLPGPPAASQTLVDTFHLQRIKDRWFVFLEPAPDIPDYLPIKPDS